MNNPYQPYRPYSIVGNTPRQNPNILSYVDSVLQKSRNTYGHRPSDPQARYSQSYANTGIIKTDTDVKNLGSSPLLVSQKSMVQQQTLKSKLEYVSPKKSDQIQFPTEQNQITSFVSNNNKVENQNKVQVISEQEKKEMPKYKNFITIKRLGVGKYSEVFLAIQIQTGFLVALKVIKKAQIIKEKMQGQLAWEIKIQYLLEHPNITRLYTFFQTQSEIVLVLEYCSHGQLNTVQQTKPNKKFVENEAAQLVQQITFALMYIHNQDVIHRDIKPDNILLSFGQVKLADFSFCVYSPDEYRQTQCGTLIYASPEILEGDMYDKKIDIWGLGVLTYELCFGKPPWKENQQELMKTACFMIPYTASRDLRDFIENLVKRLSRERYTAQQAYNHAWLQRSMQVLPFYIQTNEALFN
ncbi:unnamed protein product (macronuclear) [Paramecium tetraurelia]|uniref:Aurora kinase n=1 Tax=Paramecium tetraurelia TaxID=5888 RepID=A0BJJ6_PARTE|nr:uncharacterized protein GSPATT00029341001 [Paramecium tetraurelia]CAK58713.1 unnamed protein product [Paramecium tetraurelia]|eukprot:XP_001426111.1 hypothetical protein (macronuclear) [Paramecium tetraurelia strain d4-2]